jgi:hypothetical protein
VCVCVCVCKIRLHSHITAYYNTDYKLSKVAVISLRLGLAKAFVFCTKRKRSKRKVKGV